MVAEDFSKLWNKLSRDWKLTLEQELAPLTEGQLHILELLLESEAMKPSDLIQYLNTTPAAITTILDRMERNELITRERDERDRRVVWIQVTEKGFAEAVRGSNIRKSVIEQSLDRISSHNQQLLVYLLGKVASSS
ncbi:MULTISPECIES: MarR family winged helix-turn-helix transcriptional regulator [Paenibacillus]|uniref:MarR family winged helix-turn-helix transcriptional regulator n=1 Tax=Paenibacillus TaxID=44249 RepID=UPI002040898E|nr:MarR family transcriptional regulator [Paenibacillus camelliae]MCM3632983.1 MarR family transcriptional regulator [Paenibacillus camelliae]